MKNKQLKYLVPLLILMLMLGLKFFNQNNVRDVEPSTRRLENTNLNTTNTSAEDTITENDFNRHAKRIIYSRHARCRMDCRHIDETEVREILKNGTVNIRKIEQDDRGKTYPLEGIAGGQHLRIVFAPKADDVVEVVTCIDLDTEWQCDCH